MLQELTTVEAAGELGRESEESPGPYMLEPDDFVLPDVNNVSLVKSSPAVPPDVLSRCPLDKPGSSFVRLTD